MTDQKNRETEQTSQTDTTKQISTRVHWLQANRIYAWVSDDDSVAFNIGLILMKKITAEMKMLLLITNN